MTGWAIIGTGSVARQFVAALRHVPGARVTAVTSRRPERTRDFAEHFRIGAVCDRLEDVLCREDVDVCYIATPNDLHADFTVAALAAGKAVLCEKPIACSTVALDRVASTAADTNQFCMEAMWMRFMPIVRQAEEMIQRGEIGEPIQLLADFTQPSPPHPRNPLYDPARGGGCLLDRGVYGISLAQQLFGSPVATSAQGRINEHGAEEHAVVQMEHRSSILSTVTCGLRTWGNNAATIMGTEGVIQLSQPFFRPESLSLLRFENSAEAWDKTSTASFPPAARSRLMRQLIARVRLIKQRLQLGSKRTFHPLTFNGYEYEAMEVVRCLQSGAKESPSMTLADSRAVLEVVNAARQSIGSSREQHGFCHPRCENAAAQ